MQFIDGLSLDGLPATPDGACIEEGDSVGAWENKFSGFGCIRIDSVDGVKVVSISPLASPSPSDEDHSGLLLGPELGVKSVFRVIVTTHQQLRGVGQRQPWHSGWILAGVKDDKNYYWFAPKPNGWEFGKMIDGKQHFVRSGTKMKWPVGKACSLVINRSGATTEVIADGRSLFSFEDPKPYLGGRVGLYCECSSVSFSHVSAERG